MLGRIAFCITLLYLTGTDRRVPKWPILLIIVLQAAANIALIILFYAQCGTHLGLLWTISQTVGEEIAERCIANTVKQDVAYFVGAVNCLTDLFCTVLPAVLIERT